MFDIILEQGLIHDGTGEEPFVADIGITGKKLSRLQICQKPPPVIACQPRGCASRQGSSICILTQTLRCWLTAALRARCTKA